MPDLINLQQRLVSISRKIVYDNGFRILEQPKSIKGGVKMLKKLTIREFSDDQLDFAQKAAVTAGADPVVTVQGTKANKGDVKPACHAHTCNIGCAHPDEMFHENYNGVSAIEF